MGRPKKSQPTKPVTISAGPKLLNYLDALIKEEGYGNSRPEVAKNLVWRIIEDLIGKQVLDRQKE